MENNFKKRVFNAIDHTYHTDDKKYVGVNELLRAEGLTKDLALFVPQDKLEYAQKKGTICHKIAELRLKGILDEKSIDTRLKHQASEIDRFLADFSVIPKHIEKIFWNDGWMLAGKPDLIANTKEGLSIVDWGFGSGEHFLQLHAYKALVEWELQCNVSALIDVTIPDKGKYKYKIYKPNRDIELLIMSALKIYWYKKGGTNGKNKL